MKFDEFKEPPIKSDIDAEDDELDEDELEEAVETAIEKADKKHHMRDSTVMLLSVLAILIGAGVPIYLHHLSQPKLQSINPVQMPANLIKEASQPLIIIPLTAGTNQMLLIFNTDNTVTWRRP